MIRLGLVSAILPELSLAEVLDVCAKERFAYEGSLENRILGIRQAHRYLSQFCPA